MFLPVPPPPLNLFGIIPFPWSCVPPPPSPSDDEKPLDLSMKREKPEEPSSTPIQRIKTTSSPEAQPTLPTEQQYKPSVSSLLPYFPFGLDQNMSCPICKKAFRFEKNLLRHMQKTHSTGNGESVLKCKVCPYTTRHYSNMYVHIRTHTGE